MAIPKKLTKPEFEKYIEPNLSKAKRGYVSKIPLFKIFNYILYSLSTGCQWKQLPIDTVNNLKRSKNSMIIVEPTDEKEISYQAVYYHFRKWSKDGSFKRVHENSIQTIKNELNLSEINLDGTQTIAKKGHRRRASPSAGGESQGRKNERITVKRGNIFIIIFPVGLSIILCK